MGDRATLQILHGSEGVELYTHWGGQSSVIAALFTALNKAPDRLDDPTYFSRIVFQEMTRGFEDEILGFGLWIPNSQENEYGTFIYHADTQRIDLNERIGMTVDQFKEYVRGQVA